MVYVFVYLCLAFVATFVCRLLFVAVDYVRVVVEVFVVGVVDVIAVDV